MCGITAWLSFDQPLSRPALQAGLRLLQHRGPDYEGLWLNSQQTVALGHRALQIMDAVSGQQPLVAEQEQLVAVVNGELYDYAPLRQQLEAQGCVFKTRSDSELVIHLYAVYGLIV